MSFTHEEINAFPEERLRMVENQLVRRDIVDARVLDAMRRVPRHLFIPRVGWEEAYHDHPIAIGCGQTISQPFMVAAMTELLRVTPRSRVLEIGTGSGYQTAILASLAGEVISMERHEALASQARATLKDLGYENVEVICGDGSLGWPERAPYDAILVTAGAPRMPEALPGQLGEGGRLVAPVGDTDIQYLYTVILRGGQYISDRGMSCRFVPLVGAQGWGAG